MIDKRVFNEVKATIEILEDSLKQKIPQSFMDFLENNKCKNYFFEYDINKGIDEQDYIEDTKTMITIMYRDYFCSEEERKNLDIILEENEKKYQEEIKEKYNIEKIFQRTKEYKFENKIENNELVVYKETFAMKLLNKIKSFFNR